MASGYYRPREEFYRREDLSPENQFHVNNTHLIELLENSLKSYEYGNFSGDNMYQEIKANFELHGASQEKVLDEIREEYKSFD